MNIGNLKIYNFGSTAAVLDVGVVNLTVQNGRIYIEPSTILLSALPLEVGKIYNLTISGVEENPIQMIGIFEDYYYTAGASEYYDQEGNHQGTSVVTTSNRLQFKRI